MKLQLRYFASLREALGTGSEAWTSQAATVGGLRDELIARGGAHAEALARGRALRASLNQVLWRCSSTPPLIGHHLDRVPRLA